MRWRAFLALSTREAVPLICHISSRRGIWTRLQPVPLSSPNRLFVLAARSCDPPSQPPSDQINMDPMPEFGRTPTLEPVGGGPAGTR